MTTMTDTATTLHHWIGGANDETSSERMLDVHDPATGAVVARAPMASVADVDRAVAAAKAAFPAWRETSLTKRTTIMFAMRQLLDANREELAAIQQHPIGRRTIGTPAGSPPRDGR